MATRWTDATLTAARKDGDPEADALVERILTARAGSGGVSRGGYNHLLDLANVLVSHPELALVKSTLLRRGLDEAGEVTAFFEPMEAPDWVDDQKLQLAARLWHTDSILAIAVLYASSLPACYLMKKGVPALYNTEKLAEHKYVFQRIYETGLMLDAVMHPNGIRVVEDVAPSSDEVIVKVLNDADPEGQWEWRHHRLHRAAGHAPHAPDVKCVHEGLTAVRSAAKRYIWGGGFIAARKVRFLHASMRLMLMNPGMMRPAAAPAAAPSTPHSFMEQAAHRPTAWNVEELGKPINQEDLAFVLLTFSYLIPKGMEAWGRTIPKEEKEAFLHLWRVVGHVMGIRDDLMTDNWDEAAALYEQILKKNGGGSEPGQILTTAVMDFLRSYLPARFGLNKTAPAALIIDQLGPDWAKTHRAGGRLQGRARLPHTRDRRVAEARAQDVLLAATERAGPPAVRRALHRGHHRAGGGDVDRQLARFLPPQAVLHSVGLVDVGAGARRDAGVRGVADELAPEGL